MRLTDLLALALSALWQQKVRTLLTTLGVVFGSILLVASLSMRVGVHETILREFTRFGELRRIEVRAGYEPKDDDVPVQHRTVLGEMSEERRQRLRRALIEHWRRFNAGPPRVKLTPAEVAKLAALDHVRTVYPHVVQQGRAFLGPKAEHVATYGAAADDEHFSGRLIAGQPLDPADPTGVLVSEFALYRMGVRDDADLQRLPGTKFRLEFRSGGTRPNLLLPLLRGQWEEVSAHDELLLEKVVAHLPEALKKVKLPDADREALQRLLTRPLPKPAAPAARVSADLTVRGVIRLADEKETRKRWGWALREAEVVLPTATAAELLLRNPVAREQGFEQVVVEANELENVKDLEQQIAGMGLSTWSLVPLIERELFIYRLVFTSMTVIAVVSLLVSGLGIINTMLMSVLERVREIGVMKAVGASDWHVQTIFLVEGALVGLAGGLVGLLVTWAGSFPVDAYLRTTVEANLSVKLQGSVFAFPWWLLAGAPLFACLVTTLAAFYPARRAARVDPVTALRHD